MKYFVTGATGFIGSRLAARLRERGDAVVALVRDPSKAGPLRSLGVGVASGDITDRESMRKPMSGVDGVFHVAGWYRIGTRDQAAARLVNVEGTRNVLELMRDLQIPKGVYTSTLAVFSDTHGAIVDERYRFTGQHLSAYDASKWSAHYDVAEPMMRRGLPLVIVLPGAVYGPGDTSLIGENLRQYVRRRLPALPRGAAVCWGYIDDIVEGHILAMEKGNVGESYIIAGPPHTLAFVFREAEKLCGIRAPRLTLHPSVMRTMAALSSAVSAVVPLPPSYMPETLRVVAGVTYLGSSAKAIRELGFAPRPIAAGLRPTLEALMKGRER